MREVYVVHNGSRYAGNLCACKSYVDAIQMARSACDRRAGESEEEFDDRATACIEAVPLVEEVGA